MNTSLDGFKMINCVIGNGFAIENPHQCQEFEDDKFWKYVKEE